jgi:PAS domain-containing protein
MERLNRTIKEIEDEIVATFGFFPPMFLPVQDNAQQLDNFWQQTLNAYIHNPLPAVFKEKLAAYLSRFCPVPYCVVCHSCSLNSLGKSGNAILTLLERPVPSWEELDTHRFTLHNLPSIATGFPADDSPEEQAIIIAVALIYLYEDDGSLHQELRRLLSPTNFQNLIAFLSYVKTVHHWVQSHPIVLYEADKRAIDYLAPLLESEPNLSEFFRVYAAKVREEREIRTGKRRAIEKLAESETRYRALVETSAQIIWRTDSDGQILEINGIEDFALSGAPSHLYDLLAAVHPDDRLTLQTTWLDAMQSNIPYRHEFRLRRRNGQFTYFQCYGIPLRHPDGSVHEWVGASTDIDQQKRAATVLENDYNKQRRIADVLQRTLLANPLAEPVAGLPCATIYQPASTDPLVGGDFFDRISLSPHTVALVVADVAGKGFDAAVHTAEAKYTLRAYLRESTDPGDILTRLNRFLCETADAEKIHFLCLSLAIVSITTGRTDIAVAGSEHPLISRADGSIEELCAGEIPLGILPDSLYETTTVTLQPGDTLVLMTDGVTEVRQEDRIFGSDGVCKVLSAQQGKPVDQLAQTILETVRDFADGHLSDDVCLTLARLEPVAT